MVYVFDRKVVMITISQALLSDSTSRDFDVMQQTIVRYYVRLFGTILDIQLEKVFGNDTRYFKKILFDTDTILYQISIR